MNPIALELHPELVMLDPFGHPPTVYTYAPPPASDSRLFIYLGSTNLFTTHSSFSAAGAPLSPSTPFPTHPPFTGSAINITNAPLLLIRISQAQLRSPLHNIRTMTPLRFLLVFAYITYAALCCSALPIGTTLSSVCTALLATHIIS